MAVAFRALTTAGNSNGTTLTINKPSGVVADDVQILVFYMEHGTGGDYGSLSVSGGETWTLVNQTYQTGPGGAGRFSAWSYIQRAGGSEPASYSVTWTGTSFWRTGILAAFSGVDTTTAQDATATEAASGSSSTSATAPGLTTATNGAMVVYCETDFDGRTVTPPTGTTPTFTEPANADFGNCQICYGELASAGATGDKTGTLSSASWNTAQMIALRPAGGAPATSLPPMPPAYALQPLLGR